MAADQGTTSLALEKDFGQIQLATALQYIDGNKDRRSRKKSSVLVCASAISD